MQALYNKINRRRNSRRKNLPAVQLPVSIELKEIESTPIPHDFETEPFGLFVLHAPPDNFLPSTDIEVDIVAVHGLNGSAKKTWTYSSTGTCWLEDLLPDSIPQCRVMTFGYDSKLAFSKSRSGVETFARDLLNRLRIVRSSSEAQNRRLMFVAHSLGGIVVKKALIMAHNGSEVFAPILNATTGIVFLGTPHRGSELVPWAILLSNLVTATSLGKSIRKELLRTLNKDSSTLLEISSQFLPRATSLKIMSFVEQQIESPLTALVVPEYSAVMGLPNEIVFPMNAHHRALTKFSSKTDQNYILIEAAIREIAFGSTDKFGNNLTGTLEASAKNAIETSAFTFRSPFPIPMLDLNRCSGTYSVSRPLHTDARSSPPTPPGPPSALLSDVNFTSYKETLTNSTTTNGRRLSRLPDETVETIKVRVSGLRGLLGPDGDEERDIIRVVQPPKNTKVSDLNSYLTQEVADLKVPESFCFKGQPGSISFDWEDVFTIPVEVTSGRPSYNKERGLKINNGQSIASFMSKAFPHPIDAKLKGNSKEGYSKFDKVAASVLEIGEDDVPDLVVSFMRTLRVPENHKEYNLPLGMGKFPLFSVGPFSHILPPSMVAKGGFFLPIYQMEALWIHFHAKEQTKFAVRPFVGGVNGISGESSEGCPTSLPCRKDSEVGKQDYIVLPEQAELHGIATSPGVVEQFVATEMAPPLRKKTQENQSSEVDKHGKEMSRSPAKGDHPQGASIEWQVTGHDGVGGLQLQIIPAFEPSMIHAGLDRNLCVNSRSVASAATLAPEIGRVFDVLSTPAELQLAVGDTIHVKDLKSTLQSRPKVVSDLLDEGPSEIAYKDIVELDAVYGSHNEWAFDVKLLDSQHPSILLRFYDDDPFDCIVDIVANELQASKGSLVKDCFTANRARGWIPIRSWEAVAGLPQLTGEIHTKARWCQLTFIPGGLLDQCFVCRVVCDDTIRSPYRDILPVLLALNQDARFKDLRELIHDTTGISTSEYLITRAWSTDVAMNDNGRVFPEDTFDIPYQVPEYLLTRNKLSIRQLDAIYCPLRPMNNHSLSPDSRMGSIQILIASVTGGHTVMECDPSTTIKELKTRYQNKKGIPANELRLINQGKQLQDDLPVSHYKIGSGSTIQCVDRLRGGCPTDILRDDSIPRITVCFNAENWQEQFSDDSCIAEFKASLIGKTGIPVSDQVLTWKGNPVLNNENAMEYKGKVLVLTTKTPIHPIPLGIGAGGKVQQHIELDKNDPRIWDIDNSRIINVQLLDARSFRLVTGYAPPQTPLTAGLYGHIGLKFFESWNVEHRDTNSVSKEWGRIVSVNKVAHINSVNAMNGNNGKWGLLDTGAWGLLKGGDQVRHEEATDKDLECRLAVLNVDDTTPKFKSAAVVNRNGKDVINY